MTIKNLIISPHADDEVLGMGGTLHYFQVKGEPTHVHYCGINEKDSVNRPPREKRINELKSVAKFLGFTWSLNEDNVCNNYVERELMRQIEEVIEKIKPERIFIPFPSYNQDHRAVYYASLVATRPHDRTHFIKKVLIYEQEHPLLWDPKQITPNYFIPIDIDKKIQAYHLYDTQVRSYRSPELLKAIAKLRGSSINVPYAEGFMVYRWVD